MSCIRIAVRALALTLCLLALPQALAEPEISAENVSGSSGGVAPDLLSLTRLDARIAASRDATQRQQLNILRQLLLERLTDGIFAGDTADLVPGASADGLRALRDAAQRTRGDPDREAELLAVLKLNIAVLDVAFAQLLDALSAQWASFAPPTDFERSFAKFRQRSGFDQDPFDQAVAGIDALQAAKRSPADAELVAAYNTYKSRAESYDAVVASLQDFVIKAAGGDPLLRWFGVGAWVNGLNALPGIANVNAALFASGRMSLGQIIVALLIFVGLMGMGLVLVPLLVRRIRRMAPGSQMSPGSAQRLRRLLHGSFNPPLRVLVVLFALIMAAHVLLLRQPNIGLVTLLGIMVVLVGVWAVLRLIDNLVIVYSEPLRKRHPNLRGELVNFLSNMARIAVVIITALYLLHELGYDITTLLASLGIGGLAIAFAAKESIANVFGCISIIADDMFRQGDWIVTSDADGTVIDVGLRSTKIRTFDNAIICVPNANLASVTVRNWSRRKLGRRIRLTVGVEYGSDMTMVRKTVDDIRAMLAEHPAISDSSTDTSQYTKQQLTRIANAMDSQGVKQTLLVYLDALGESSINIVVYCFSKSVDWEEWLKVQQDVIFRCCDIVERNGLNIAFPSRTVYLRGEGAAVASTHPGPGA